VVREKIAAKIARYQSYKFLSVFGRALLAKACLLSHAWYPASVSPYDEETLSSLFKWICKFVHTPSPGFKLISYANSRLPRSEGGLGMIDPGLQVRAIHAHRIALLLLRAEDPSPWRMLLWHSLLSVKTHQRVANVLSYAWVASSFTERSLAADMLLAWSMLSPRNVPDYEAPKWRFVGNSMRPTSLPPIPTFKEIIVCGNLKLTEISVKKVYRYLREKDFSNRSRDALEQDLCSKAHLIKPLSFLPLPGLWKKRWKWLTQSPLPIKVRQTVWRRWNQKLYLGPVVPISDALDDDDPAQLQEPRCPYNEFHVDTPHHFVRHCQVARSAQLYLVDCWRMWEDQEPVASWINEEYSPHAAWNVAFACLLHALYAGRMHRLDVKFAQDSPLQLLLYVIALFQKLVNATARAGVGETPAIMARLERLNWPHKWCGTAADGTRSVKVQWPALQQLRDPAQLLQLADAPPASPAPAPLRVVEAQAPQQQQQQQQDATVAREALNVVPTNTTIQIISDQSLPSQSRLLRFLLDFRPFT
jgi:hypothetical protein